MSGVLEQSHSPVRFGEFEPLRCPFNPGCRYRGWKNEGRLHLGNDGTGGIRHGKEKGGHLTRQANALTIRNIQLLRGNIDQPGNDGHSDQKAGQSISHYK